MVASWSNVTSGSRKATNAREQLLILRRPLAEHIDHLLPMLHHFSLLQCVADQDGPGRKAWLACGVLRMEVRGGEEELRIVGASFAAMAAVALRFSGPGPYQQQSVARLP